MTVVALLAEGVDRNTDTYYLKYKFSGVALLAEGVDRNQTLPGITPVRWSRPPRGGRG